MTGFVKHYPSVQAAEAAVQRAWAARRAGVLTPAVLERIGPKSVCFERIEGRGQPDAAALMQVLPSVNRMPHCGLLRFDPFLRIRPRLPGAPKPIRDLAHQLMETDASMNWPQTAVIHGDFHPGQVLCDAQGLLWLVDLDDLALAPREADLGNLAAWMATQGLQDLSPPAAVLDPSADPALTRHFFAIALLRRALKLAGKGQTDVLSRLALWA